MHRFRLVADHVRRQPVAYLALVVAMSGTAVAATPLVTSAGVANNSLTSLDVRNESLTTADVKNRSLLAKDFKAGQLPRGAKGDTGATGPAGPQGTQGVPGTVAIGAWHTVGEPGEPTIGSGWALPSPVQRLRFRLEGDVVRLDGQFEPVIPGTQWNAIPNPLFVLPAGYRPLVFTPFLDPNVGLGSGAYLTVSYAGAVTPAGAHTGFGSLDGLTFPIS